MSRFFDAIGGDGKTFITTVALVCFTIIVVAAMSLWCKVEIAKIHVEEAKYNAVMK